MSVSLISRQLHTLRLGQTAASAVGASWLAPVTRAGAASTAAAAAPTATATMGFTPLSIPQHHDTLSSSRPFSSHVNIHERPISSSTFNYHTSDDDDDGGPVTSSFATTPTNLQHMSIKELSDMSTIPGWNLVHNPPRKNPRGALVGRVVSDKMQKTVNVAVDRYKIIPKYRKRWRFTKKFMAHDEHEVCNMGDLVMIVPCQKISRHKHFMVREIIRPKGLL